MSGFWSLLKFGSICVVLMASGTSSHPSSLAFARVGKQLWLKWLAMPGGLSWKKLIEPTAVMILPFACLRLQNGWDFHHFVYCLINWPVLSDCITDLYTTCCCLTMVGNMDQWHMTVRWHHFGPQPLCWSYRFPQQTQPNFLMAVANCWNPFEARAAGSQRLRWNLKNVLGKGTKHLQNRPWMVVSHVFIFSLLGLWPNLDEHISQIGGNYTT